MLAGFWEILRGVPSDPAWLLLVGGVIGSVAWWVQHNERHAGKAGKRVADSDALDYVVVDGHRPLSLSVDYNTKGFPVMFPILIRNTRPANIELRGFDVAVFDEAGAWHSISWSSRSDSLTSAGTNGARPTIEVDGGAAHPIGENNNTIPHDNLRIIRIPIQVAQVAGYKPAKPPAIRVTGKLSLRCGSKSREVDVPGDFLPRLSQDEWDKVLKVVSFGEGENK